MGKIAISIPKDTCRPFFGYAGLKYLLVIDGYSKRVEVPMVKSTSVAETIQKLQEIFNFVGNPTVMVSDNGPPFTNLPIGVHLMG